MACLHDVDWYVVVELVKIPDRQTLPGCRQMWSAQLRSQLDKSAEIVFLRSQSFISPTILFRVRIQFANGGGVLCFYMCGLLMGVVQICYMRLNNTGSMVRAEVGQILDKARKWCGLNGDNICCIRA